MGTIVSCNQRETPSIETCDGYLIENFVQCWKCPLNPNIKQFKIGKSNDYSKESNQSVENKNSVFVPDAIKRYQSPNLWRDHVKSKVIGEQASCKDQSHQQLYTESLECPLCTGKKSSKLTKNASNTLWNQKSLNNAIDIKDSSATNTDSNQSKSVSSILTARSSSTPKTSTCKLTTIAEINKTVRKCFDEINDEQMMDQYKGDNSFKTSVEVLERASMSTSNSFKAPLVTIDPPKSINENETNLEKLKDEIEKDKADEIHYSEENETLSDRKREEKSIEPDIRLSQDTGKEELQSDQKVLTLLKSEDGQSSTTSIDNWYAVAKDDKNIGFNSNDDNILSDGNSNSCSSDIYDNVTIDQNVISNVPTKSIGNEFVLNSLDNISLSSLSTVESDNDSSTNALIPSRLHSNMSSYQTQLMVSQLEKSAFTGSIGTMRCSLCRLYQLGSETFWLSLDDDILTILKLYQSLSECLREKERQLWNNNVELEYKERIARLRMRKRTRISIEKQSDNKVVVILKDGHTVYCIEGE